MSYSIRFRIVAIDAPPDDPGEWRELSPVCTPKSYPDAIAAVKPHVPEGYRILAIAGGQFSEPSREV